MNLQRGMRGSLGDLLNTSDSIIVSLSVIGNAEYDYTCFGLDQKDKLSDDRYMIFYNQTASPNNEIKYSLHNNTADFVIRLDTLTSSIQKLVFTVNIDGIETMGMIKRADFHLTQQGKDILSMLLSGNDFSSEKAIIMIEIYRKNGAWRYNCVARGFNGGLSELLKQYGGTEIVNSSSVPKSNTNQNQQINKPSVNSVSFSHTNNVNQSHKVIETVKQKPATPVFGTSTQQMSQYQQAKPTPSVVSQPQKKEKISLKKGEKVSLTKSTAAYIRIENGWTAEGIDYDLKALVRYRNGGLVYIGAANDDEYLQTFDGAVKHGGDIKHPGELEHIDIRWHPDIASVAVSSYSAIENGTGSFKRYGVYVRIINGNQVIEIPAADTSADDRSYTLCFGEILYGKNKDELTVSALEMYSSRDSENRIGYQGDRVVMDIGPTGRTKD